MVDTSHWFLDQNPLSPIIVVTTLSLQVHLPCGLLQTSWWWCHSCRPRMGRCVSVRKDCCHIIITWDGLERQEWVTFCQWAELHSGHLAINFMWRKKLFEIHKLLGSGEYFGKLFRDLESVRAEDWKQEDMKNRCTDGYTMYICIHVGMYVFCKYILCHQRIRSILCIFNFITLIIFFPVLLYWLESLE